MFVILLVSALLGWFISCKQNLKTDIKYSYFAKFQFGSHEPIIIFFFRKQLDNCKLLHNMVIWKEQADMCLIESVLHFEDVLSGQAVQQYTKFNFWIKNVDIFFTAKG